MILSRLIFVLIIMHVFEPTQLVGQSLSSPDDIAGQKKNIRIEDEIKLVYTLDLGNPPSGLNASKAGNYFTSLGDINGDHFDDWAVGLPFAANYYGNGDIIGAIHIYYGNSLRKTSETPADLVIYGSKDQKVGQNITAAGDVNGDGFDDMLSNNYVPNHITSPGFLWSLYLGGSQMDTIVDLTFSKLDSHEGYVRTASAAGDVNNDGYGDILLSVEPKLYGVDTSHVYVFFGGKNMDNIPDIILDGQFNIPGYYAGNGLFSTPIGAGDVNSDGFDDVIVKSYEGAELFFGGLNMDKERDLYYHNFDGSTFGTQPDVHGIGDVNNDGFADVLAVINSVQTRGIYRPKTAYVFYGGEEPDTVPDLKIPLWREDQLADFSSASAGDVNNDGYDDLMLGTGGLSTLDSTAQVRVFLGGEAMDSIADFTLSGSVPYTNFGFSLGGGGDFDGDGFDDILVGDVGLPATFIVSDDAGNLSIFYGANTINEKPDAVFSGVAENYGFGKSVANAGDVNKDGYSDLLVGAPNYYDRYYAGRAFLYLGGDTVNKDPDLIFDTPTRYNGERRFLGKKVGSAGDVNGDGYNDIFILETFRVFIYLGGPDMDTQPDYAFKSPTSTATKDKYRFAGVGDVNKDGFDDVLFSDLSVGKGGTAWLYLGGANLMDAFDVTFTGANSGDNLGNSLSNAGDLNGDGYMDFLISVPGDDANGTDAGCIHVYLGGEIIKSTPFLIIPGIRDKQNFGITELDGGRDINNDGYSDIVYSDPNFSLTASSREGRIYVFYGGTDMDSIPDVILTGDSTSASLGLGLRMLADVNRDGFDDLLTKNNVILYGSKTIDQAGDLFIESSGSFNDFSYTMEDSTIVLYYGDQGNSGPGPGLGRVFAYSNGKSEISSSTSLTDAYEKPNGHKNYPNPFAQSTIIEYYLPFDEFVKISVYNLLGELVCTLISEHQFKGHHKVRFNAEGLNGGVYIYCIESGETISTGKMSLLK